MWNEPSAGIAVAAEPNPLQAQTGQAPSRLPQPAVVATVEPGSIGEELGFHWG
ncbi:MAG: hypothetical protein R6U00_12770 [Prochlorococcaceae cyanobacterium]